MNQQSKSEDGLRHEDEGPPPRSARVLPFERPQSEMQKAVQLRAQQALDLDRERSARKFTPVRWAVTAGLAIIPVFAIFGAAVAFMQAYHGFVGNFKSKPAPPAPVIDAQKAEPGIVPLQFYPAPVQPASPPAVESQR